MVQQQVCTFAQTPTERPDLTLQVISEPEQFLKVGEPWDRLVAQSDIHHPYVSHTWLTTWWEYFGAGHDLRIFVLRSGNEWTAVAPMMIRRTTMYGVPIRRLEALYNHHTPRCEFPICDHSAHVYRLLWQAMSDPDGKWDAILFQQFAEDSPTLSSFQGLAEQDSWLTGVWVGPASPFIPLSCDYDTLFNRLKPREQHNLRKRFKKLSAIGDVQLEIVSSPSQAREAIDDGLSIEAAGWKGHAGTAMASDARVRQFYIRFAERAAALGQLRLAFLRVGGKRIAFFYLLESAGVVHAMKVGYDPEFQTYSPGHMLLMLILKQACDQHRIEFDFQGTAERWKLVWTTESRRYPWLFMFRDRWRSRLLHRAKFIVLPAVRNLRRAGV